MRSPTSGLNQQVDRILLQHSFDDTPFLHIFPASTLQHNRLDALQMQKVRQQQNLQARLR